MWNGINRRKFPRANYPCVITVKRKDESDAISTQTENIGLGGICVMLPKDLGIFAPVEIELDLLDDQPIIECEGAIVWIIPQKEKGFFDTGIEFTNLKRKDETRVQAIVDKVLDTGN